MTIRKSLYFQNQYCQSDLVERLFQRFWRIGLPALTVALPIFEVGGGGELENLSRKIDKEQN